MSQVVIIVPEDNICMATFDTYSVQASSCLIVADFCRVGIIMGLIGKRIAEVTQKSISISKQEVALDQSLLLNSGVCFGPSLATP